jgi:hypothetical protein
MPRPYKGPWSVAGNYITLTVAWDAFAASN